jgi:hypothetical protein
MRARLRKFIKLPRPDRRLLVSAIVALIKARLTVAFVPLRKILQPVAPHSGAISSDSDLARITWAVDAASRIVPTARNCLVRAIAGRELLARGGVSSQLRLGIVKSSRDRLSGHSWLECGGRIITGEGEHRSHAEIPERASHVVS